MTKDEILSMASESGFGKYAYEAASLFERFAALVAEKEREACAKVCEAKHSDKRGHDAWGWMSEDYAAAIRARGQKEYRGARLVLTKDGVIQDGWMGESK